MISDLDICIRVAVAFVLGGIIGYERQSRNKWAGLRTHVLVCLGSCLIMILSINIYYSVQGQTNADPARLAAQVVSGIGFLGAGTIMKEGATVKGLTTAASIWVVSGVGLAVGAGYFLGALFTTCLVLLTLTTLSRLEKSYSQGYTATLLLSIVDKPGQIGKIGSYLGQHCVSIRDIRIEEHDDHGHSLLVTLMLHFPDRVNVNEVIANLMAIDGVMAVKRE